MSSCCSNSATPSASQVCPQCGNSCKSVEMRTLYHQVKFPENQDIVLGKYYYCEAKKCSIAYFSISGIMIPKQNLRTQKDVIGDKLCYCFDIDTEQYLAKLSDNTSEPLKSFVIQKTKSGDCACDIKNPSGQCCLAKFKQLEKQHRNVTP